MHSFQTDDNEIENSRVLLPKLWRRIAPILYDNRGRVGFALACLLLAKAALLLIPFLLKALVDGLDQSAAQVTTSVILFMVAAYGAARFANTLFAELRDTLFGRVTERAMHRIGLAVFKHIHSLDLDYHLNRRTGGLARDIERGTNGISFLMRFFIFNIAPTLFEIAMVATILLFNYGAQYSFIVLLSVALYGAFSFRATRWRTRYIREANAADSESNTRAVDSLINYETVKYFNNEEFEAQRYDESLEQWEQARRKNRLSLLALNSGQAIIIALSQTLMLGLAALSVQDSNMTLGDFVLINQFMLQLFIPLSFLGFVYREIKASLASIERLFRVLDQQPAVMDQPEADVLKMATGAIEFRQVNFGYSDARQVLSGLNFTIDGGETVALVGASGAGKSTVVKLLFRFYDPSSGTVYLDGQNIRDVTQNSLRSSVAIVPQDCVLFNDSLLENIRYGRPTATDEEVNAAVAAAYLDDFVARLPEGISTRVGERGLKLSGGERQRVAIARAVLKSAPILVFDEATSSLDSESERAVMRAFRALAGHHTAVVIAHRLSTIVDADRILVLEDGRLVEQGKHEALLAQDGRYTALWQAQQRETGQQA
ncbi:ABCB family ABC transporter ATP-binding protein/permease [Luminiphilus sp. nBUS_16]|uniref:ABCB family ABC transporter ATP-binding protein/permease n=1 Tax=Luminiphilus sp. nBUS_16 TaxID=3395315 RepID=UPI003EBEFCAE